MADKWILSRLNTLIKEVTENMGKFELGVALQKLYEFIWDEFCDWYIELVKPRLYDRENETRGEAQYVLNYVLANSMKLLHPYMPFITEEIYGHLVTDDESIMISKWPEYREDFVFKTEEKSMQLIMDAIRNIRNIRAEMNVPLSKPAKLIFVCEGAKQKKILNDGASLFKRLAGASEVIVQSDKKDIPNDAVSSIINGAEIYIPLEDLIDIKKEIERLEKEKANLQKELKRVDGKLNNEGFTSKAPQSVIDEEKAKKEKYKTMFDKVEERLKSLQK